MPKKKQTVGEYLKNARLKRGLSTRDADRLSYVSNVYISQLEHDKYKPTLEIISRLLEAYELDWLDFITKTGLQKPVKWSKPRRKV